MQTNTTMKRVQKSAKRVLFPAHSCPAVAAVHGARAGHAPPPRHDSPETSAFARHPPQKQKKGKEQKKNEKNGAKARERTYVEVGGDPRGAVDVADLEARRDVLHGRRAPPPPLWSAPVRSGVLLLLSRL